MNSSDKINKISYVDVSWILQFDDDTSTEVTCKLCQYLHDSNKSQELETVNPERNIFFLMWNYYLLCLLNEVWIIKKKFKILETVNS